jgi:hypothetical protein
MKSVDDYRDRLEGTKVVLHVVPALSHAEELTRIDAVLAPMLEFTRVSNG